MMIGILPVKELEQVPAALERAAAYGLPDAWLELARWHASPPFGGTDLPAMERALRSARAAHAPGAEQETVRLRWIHRSQVFSDDRREAFDLAQGLVTANPADAVALYYLGLLTFQGFGTTADPAAAAALQQKAAALGNTDAVFELYVHHHLGLGVAADPQAAFEWVRRAAEGGHDRAMYNMGAFHATGQHVAKDAAQAVEWYERASEAGNLQATATLAVLYARGDGVEKDVERALELFEEAESMGFDTSELRELAGI